MSMGLPIIALIGLTGHQFPTTIHLKPLALRWVIGLLGYRVIGFLGYRVIGFVGFVGLLSYRFIKLSGKTRSLLLDTLEGFPTPST